VRPCSKTRIGIKKRKFAGDVSLKTSLNHQVCIIHCSPNIYNEISVNKFHRVEVIIMRKALSTFVSLLIIGTLFLFFSPTIGAIVTVPGAPINCTRTITSNITGYHMNLSWDPPTDNGGAQITGYKIEYTDSLGGYSGNQSDIWNILVADTGSTETSYIHSHSTSEAYCYRVSAINSEGVGLPSVYFPSCGHADVPDFPINIQCVRVSGTQVDISWDIEDDNGLPVIGYKIEYKTYSDPDVKVLVENTNSKGTSYSDTSATTDWTYYRVYAINALGSSELSIDWAMADNWVSENPAVPGPPKNMSAVDIGCGINITWDPPSDEGGSSITGYLLYYGPSEQYVHHRLSISINATQYTFRHEEGYLLNCGDTCCFQVFAMNAYGEGQGSSIACALLQNCYDDYDCDGVINVVDNCPENYNPLQEDSDNDGYGDICDDCPDDSSNMCDEAFSNNDTPGFECVFLFLAVILVLYFIRKK
jgi:hypothetical protein